VAREDTRFEGVKWDRGDDSGYSRIHELEERRGRLTEGPGPTWVRCRQESQENPEAELTGGDHHKDGGDQLTPASHCIYPVGSLRTQRPETKPLGSRLSASWLVLTLESRLSAQSTYRR